MNKNFVKRVGKEIHDIYDKPFTLRGVGIGGWLLIEGYMIGSYKDIDRPNRLEHFITSKIDEDYKNYFIDEWTRHYFTKDDIKLIKKSGFNSIRIPLDYQFLFEKSDTIVELNEKEANFQLLDDLIDVCRTLEVYVILDLHAAPGGQTGTNIDNSLNNRPELFEKKIYQQQLCYIWKKIASHYKDESIIAAYDLLNEPLPEWFAMHNDQLMPLYKEIIEEIRLVDSNHMITLEGLHWSTDWTCFKSLPDENILLQFHKYWSNPDIESIQQYLDIQEQLNVPIFMGEGGENNPLWYSSVFKMYDELNISFNFWTYKKMDNTNSILSFDKPNNWDALLQGKLTKEESKIGLDQLLHNIKFKHVKINGKVINSIHREGSFSTPGYAFDYLAGGISSCIEKPIESSFRVNEGIRITDKNKKVITPNFKQYGGEEQQEEEVLYVHLLKNESVKYTFYSYENPSYYKISLEMNNPSLITFKINGISHKIEDGDIKLTITKKINKLVLTAKDEVIIKQINFKQYSN